MKQLERLLFLQGQHCFFCQQTIPAGEASVEHLVASANGGTNADENCVACCKSVNAALGSLSIKEKLQVVLNQRGTFTCPRTQKSTLPKETPDDAPNGTPLGPQQEERIAAVVEGLLRLGVTRPRKVATLQNTMAALFQKKLTDGEIASLFAALVARNLIAVDGQKVAYALPQRTA